MSIAEPNLRTQQAADLDPSLGELIASVMKRYVVPGLALGLVSDGAQVLHGFGVTSIENPLPVDDDTIFVAGSVTKTVVATTVTCLVDRRELELDLPIRTYLPDLRLADETVAAAVTLRHLMTHSAGWAGDDVQVTDFGHGDDALARAIASFGNRPQVLPLGSLWSYNNSGFWLAGRVIEVATGMSLEAAITQLIFRPLGMVNSFFFESDAITRRIAVGHIVGEGGKLTVARPWSTPRAYHAAGGMLTTIADLMTFARFHLGDGLAGDGERVMSAKALHSMREPQLAGAGLEYAGIGWVVRELAGHRVLSHGGDWNGQQALITLIPDRKLAIGSLANSGQARSANDAIAAWALRRYLGSADPEPVPVEHDDERLDALVGRYALPSNAIEIVRRGNRLGIMYLPSVRPTMNNPVVPEQPAALTTDGRLVVLEGPFEGVTGDFSLQPDGSVAWVRLGGRIYPRQTEPKL
jgi:CubicO group peptidase (beta-lactamase class C family)